MARLVFVSGPRLGESVELTRQELVLGRDHFPLAGDPSLSTTHARLYWQRSLLLIADAGSQWGTVVNGQRSTEPVHLNRGDLIQIGNHALRLENAFDLTERIAEKPALDAIGLCAVFVASATVIGLINALGLNQPEQMIAAGTAMGIMMLILGLREVWGHFRSRESAQAALKAALLIVFGTIFTCLGILLIALDLAGPYEP